MKHLKELTQDEYNNLKKAGMLTILYPEATGNYELDKLDNCTEYFNEKFGRPTCKVGDWVHTNYSPLPFGKINKFYDAMHAEVVSAQGSGTMCTIYDLRSATPSEIESHLI